MSQSDRIRKEAESLDEYADYDSSILTPLVNEAEKVAKSWSGSFLGYHSRVYYENLVVPPAGAHFSTEWGLYSGYDTLGMGCTGEWVEYTFDGIVEYINEKAGNPDTIECKKHSLQAIDKMEDVKNTILSIIHSNKSLAEDNYLQKLVKELEEIKSPTAKEYHRSFLPKGNIITRDRTVEHKIQIPPHLSVICSVYEVSSAFLAAKNMKKVSLRVADYLNNLEFKMEKESRIGTNVFIGHGRSYDWRDLKDFVNERLNLPWDEFNRVPVAGLTNITRLAQMLDQACIAFLVMSAEDEQSDGNHHARMNVIHEVGLFQGRLGFERAIVLLEEGCEEFSNIQGLGQIRYPKGNISAVFEDIRQVLEREGIV
ncbi:nucleotide-binding protein [Vibrio metoecus]|uniref:nucleotide-binding protein n=1 Tax=Vibrio metoecus TaxID=1481663 RepID=UPI00215B9CE3|nr:nucleotide-binding protein [Vibrio metoecus]MCR9387599.1 nucleotide-binding protein [Vibrio metoecus]